MLKANDSKSYIEHMKRYIGNHMSNYGFEKEIVIIGDEDKYIDKLGQFFEISNEDDKLNKIVRTLLILQV